MLLDFEDIIVTGGVAFVADVRAARRGLVRREPFRGVYSTALRFFPLVAMFCPKSSSIRGLMKRMISSTGRLVLLESSSRSFTPRLCFGAIFDSPILDYIQFPLVDIFVDSNQRTHRDSFGMSLKMNDYSTFRFPTPC